MVKQEKVLIFSHENDVDGMGCVVLAKLAFEDLDYVLASNVYILEKKFREYLEKGLLDQYDRVLVTDLALHNPSLDMVGSNSSLSSKVLVFDHHQSSINEGLNKYDFTKIMEEDENGIRRCGTSLLYTYLCSNGLLQSTKDLDDFVELTRLEDIWEWKKAGSFGLKAHDLATLFNALGKDKYINNMFVKLKNNTSSFEYSDEEERAIANKKAEYLVVLKKLWSEAEYFVDDYNNKCAGVYADYEYRNELAEYVSGLNEEELKYLVIIELDKGDYGQKSYRSIEDGFNVSKIAEAHGGGGHPTASSVNITKDQREKALVLRKRSHRESVKYLVDSSFK